MFCADTAFYQYQQFVVFSFKREDCLKKMQCKFYKSGLKNLILVQDIYHQLILELNRIHDGDELCANI